MKFLTLILLLGLCEFAIADSKNRIEGRILVHLTSNDLKANFLKRLPPGVKIEREDGHTIILQYNKNITDKDLIYIQNLHEVRSAAKDRVLGIQQATCSADQPLIFRDNSDILKKIDQILLLSDTSNLLNKIDKNNTRACNFFPTCGENQLIKNWANEAIDADLMFDEMKRLNISSNSIKIGVIDSGFDLAGNKENINEKNIKVFQGFPYTSESGIDRMGHGTGVAGLIAAKNGNGFSPQSKVSVYSVTQDQDLGKISMADVFQLIRRACSEGNEIINVSIGSPIEEVSSNRFYSEENNNLFQEMESKGCLIFKASGNSGKKDVFTSDGNINAFITVGSIGLDGKNSYFSSASEIQAPGEQVFTLISSSHEDKIAPTCDNGVLSNGTSFASPVSAAVGSNVLAVLKSSEKFKALPNPERIKVLKRIMKDSIIGPSVSGYKAIKDAAKWIGLETRLPSDCESSAPNCRDLPSCSDKQKLCLNQKRSKIFQCAPRSNDADIEDLALTAINSGYPELSSLWLQKLVDQKVKIPAQLIAPLKANLLSKVQKSDSDYLSMMSEYELLKRISQKKIPEVDAYILKGILADLEGSDMDRNKLQLHSAAAHGLLSGKEAEKIMKSETYEDFKKHIVIDAMINQVVPVEDLILLTKSIVLNTYDWKLQKYLIEALGNVKVDIKEPERLWKEIHGNGTKRNVVPSILNALNNSYHYLGDLNKLVPELVPMYSANHAEQVKAASNFIYNKKITPQNVEKISNIILGRNKNYLRNNSGIIDERKYYIMAVGQAMTYDHPVRKSPEVAEKLINSVASLKGLRVEEMEHVLIAVMASPMDWQKRKKIINQIITTSKDRDVDTAFTYELNRYLLQSLREEAPNPFKITHLSKEEAREAINFFKDQNYFSKDVWRSFTNITPKN